MTVIPQHAIFCPLNQILHLKIIANNHIVVITAAIVVITAVIVGITAVIVIIPFAALKFNLLINN